MRRIVRTLAIAAAASAATTVSAGLAAAQEADSLTAELMTADGQNAGTVTFTQMEHGVLVTADLQNLPPGPHGFHIHEHGACAPDFEAAGGHYAPGGHEHGYDNAAGFHAGDLPNVHVAADGTAKADFFASWLTLGEGGGAEVPFSLTDQDGSAVMVHESGDSYAAESMTGSRIACGVIAAPKG